MAVPDREGRLVGQLRTPEGLRPYAMFQAVAGDTPKFDIRGASLFGAAAANLHLAGSAFDARGLRRLDVDYLVKAPLRHIEPALADRIEDWRYLVELGRRLEDQLIRCGSTLSTGLCHGDLHGGNAVVDSDRLRLFDFECCGTGYHSYDNAVYRWTLEVHASADADELWAAFCAAYNKIGALAVSDRQASGPFVLVRHLWNLGLDARGLGPAIIGTPELDRYIKYFRVWEERFLNTAT